MNLADCKHLIVFGGSFDPPQVAHVALPEFVRQRVGADVVVYVPAARSPHKLDRPPTDARHRLAMLRLALQGAEHATILTDEIDRAQHGVPSYTVDTLAALRDRLRSGGRPGARVRLLVGTDQVHAFDRWKEPERVAAMAEPLVMVRPPETRASLLAALPDDAARAEWAGRLIEVPRMDVSSTDVRERIGRGEPIEGLVPPAVERYIREHGLYGRGSPKSQVQSPKSEGA